MILVKNLTQMKRKALFKLDDFCNVNGIEYMVTGTVALSYLGVYSPYEPEDIDIKVFHIKPEQRDKLKELQHLSGLNENEHYDSECYTFIVNDVKVNAIIDNEPSYDRIEIIGVTLDMIDEERSLHRKINVEKVCYALKDKMKLNRPKDKDYMLNLIKNLPI